MQFQWKKLLSNQEGCNAQNWNTFGPNQTYDYVRTGCQSSQVQVTKNFHFLCTLGKEDFESRSFAKAMFFVPSNCLFNYINLFCTPIPVTFTYSTTLARNLWSGHRLQLVCTYLPLVLGVSRISQDSALLFAIFAIPSIPSIPLDSALTEKNQCYRRFPT